MAVEAATTTTTTPENTTTTTPKSPHVADPAIAPFLQPTFDPATYLNATLPSLSLSSLSSRPLKQTHSASLATLSSQTQDLLSQLNAHTTRLSAILTQLTDDILRSGARLAYEVDVLRGETTALTETLTDGLKGHVERFVPGGVSLTDAEPSSLDHATDGITPTTSTAPAEKEQREKEQEQKTPAHITHLHLLAQVRSRLDAVIRVFGEAMHWTLPPAPTSSLISVSAPDPEPNSQRGVEFAAALRDEIAGLIVGGDADADPEAGLEAAEARIQALRDLCGVWKGTAEEKARVKFVEGLVKLAGERYREVEAQRQQQQQLLQQRAGRSGSVTAGDVRNQGQQHQQPKSGGFLENLQRIRGGFGE